MAGQPTPPNVTSPGNKGLIAGLIKAIFLGRGIGSCCFRNAFVEAKVGPGSHNQILTIGGVW